MFFNNEISHRRYNPLTAEWVLVSPHRTKRPWQGKIETLPPKEKPSYVEDCYLCPSNKRAGDNVNPDYKDTFVFTNDFAALLPDVEEKSFQENDLFKVESVKGTSRVICFSPNHSLTIPDMEIKDIKKVIDVWAEQYKELGEKYKWVQVFENKGAIMGCSNPHPHGQIWASSSLPNEPFKKDKNQQKYFKKNNSILLLDYLKYEKKYDERIITENDDWIIVVPFWAVWPFETMLLPKRHVTYFFDLTETERNNLAKILKKHLSAYDKIFETSFPYTMGWHGAPFNKEENKHWLLHAQFYPPLLRSATIKKFMVGYEMLAEPQRDITAEQAAERLREAINKL